MPMLVAGLLLLWLSSYLLRGFVGANPAVLSRRLRKTGGWAALGFAVVMILRGELNLAFGAGLFGFWLLGTQPGWANGLFGSGTGRGPGGIGRRRPRASRVATASLEMVLDPATGRITGRCFQGPFAGRVLDDLSEADCVALYDWCGANDREAVRLVETYLDRRFARWREAGQGAGDPGRNGPYARTDEPAGMSEREAHEMLGLPQGASKEEITRAHRRLMMKFHPDQGGTTAMAARINEAKDVLMRKHA